MGRPIWVLLSEGMERGGDDNLRNAQEKGGNPPAEGGSWSRLDRGILPHRGIVPRQVGRTGSGVEGFEEERDRRRGPIAVLLVQFTVQGLAVYLEDLGGKGLVASHCPEDMVHIPLHHIRHGDQFACPKIFPRSLLRVGSMLEYFFWQIFG